MGMGVAKPERCFSMITAKGVSPKNIRLSIFEEHHDILPRYSSLLEHLRYSSPSLDRTEAVAAETCSLVQGMLATARSRHARDGRQRSRKALAARIAYAGAGFEAAVFRESPNFIPSERG